LVIGSFTAFYQIKLKRLLIYSAIVNNSFFLLSFSGGTFLNLQSFILYLYFYIILIFGLFTLLLSLRRLNNFFLIKKIYELKYLFFINPLLALTFSFFLFSIAGIPPFIGFFGKFYIFYSLLDISVFFIIVFFILLSIFSVFYYIRLINIMFFSIFSKIFYIDN
jgi:NADH-quinone oxidoreductase subunit N